MKRLLPFLLILILGACTPTYAPPPVSAEHPAGTVANQVPDTHAVDILSTDLVVETTWKRPATTDPAPGEGLVHQHGEQATQQENAATPGNEHQHGDDAATREGTIPSMQEMQHQHGSTTPARDHTASPMQTTAFPPEVMAHMRHLLGAYLSTGSQLSSDALDEVPENAREIVAAMDVHEKITIPAQPHFWHERAGDLDVIREESERLATAADLPPARVAFGRLSDALDRLIQATGAPSGYEQPLYRFVCGMFLDAPQGGVWFQLGDQPRNPYFGSQMLTCHREKTPVPVSGKPAEMDHDGMDHNHMNHQNMDHQQPLTNPQHQHQGEN